MEVTDASVFELETMAEKLPFKSEKIILSLILISAPAISSPLFLSIILPEINLVVSFTLQLLISPARVMIEIKTNTTRKIFFIILVIL